ETAGRDFRLIKASCEKIRRDFTVQTGGQADETLAVFREQILVDAWLVIKTLEVSFGNELDEIFVAGFVLTKKDQVVWPARRRVAILSGGFRNIHLATDDRFNAGLGGRF